MLASKGGKNTTHWFFAWLSPQPYPRLMYNVSCWLWYFGCSASGIHCRQRLVMLNKEDKRLLQNNKNNKSPLWLKVKYSQWRHYPVNNSVGKSLKYKCPGKMRKALRVIEMLEVKEVKKDSVPCSNLRALCWITLLSALSSSSALCSQGSWVPVSSVLKLCWDFVFN